MEKEQELTGVKGIILPCESTEPKILKNLSVKSLKFAADGKGGTITVELIFEDVLQVAENETIDLKKNQIFFQLESDGSLKGAIDKPRFTISGANMSTIQPVVGKIGFVFGASKVGPGSGKVGPGSGKLKKAIRGSKNK